MVFDTRHVASIGGNLRHVRRLSWEVKERLSPDTWRVLQQLSTQLSTDASRPITIGAFSPRSARSTTS